MKQALCGTLDRRKLPYVRTSSDLIHTDSSFAGFTLNGEIKQGSITQCLSKDLEDATKERLDRIYTHNEEGHFNHNMERLSWYDTDEIC